MGLPCLPSVAGSFVALAKKDSEGGSVIEWVEGIAFFSSTIQVVFSDSRDNLKVTRRKEWSIEGNY